jgi:hypothetical protein
MVDKSEILRCPKCGEPKVVFKKRTEEKAVKCGHCGYEFGNYSDICGRKGETLGKKEADNRQNFEHADELIRLGSLLRDIDKASEDYFSTILEWGVENDFVRRAKEMNFSDLGDSLRGCKNKKEAIRAVEKKMKQLGWVGPIPQIEPSGKPDLPKEPIAPIRPKPVGDARERCFHFPSAEKLIQFLDMVIGHRRQPTALKGDIRIRIPGISQVGMDVRLPADICPELDGPLRNAIELMKGKERQKNELVPGGGWTSLNEFLERIRLRAQPDMPERMECIFVYKPGADLEEMVEVYHSFPKGEYLNCRFFSGRDAEGSDNDEFTLLLFEDIKNIPRVSKWASKILDEHKGAGVYYPIGGSAQDIFFCQWQHVYPVAALPRLYDCGESRYILMNSRTPKSSRPWLRILRQHAEESFKWSNQVLNISVDKTDDGYKPHDVIPLDSEIKPLDLPLRAVRSPGIGLAASTTLARRIEPLRRQLSDLETKYAKIQQATLGQCRAAFIFFQDRDSEPLAPRLRRFLNHPYQTLVSYTYAFLDVGNKPKHVLFSKEAVPLADALVSCADQVYVQDPRWRAWGLNFFLRHGVYLSPRLDDPAMAEKFREYFQSSKDFGSMENVLIDAVPTDSGKSSECRLIIIGIPKTYPLLDKVRLFNEEFSGAVRAVVKDYPETLKASLELRGLEVSHQLSEYEKTMAEELSRRAAYTSEQWEELHVYAEKILDEIAKSKEDAKKIEQVINDNVLSWGQFVESILKLHLDFSTGKRVAMHRLNTNLEEFKLKVEEANVANSEASKKINEAFSLIEQRKWELSEVENVTRAEYAKLNEMYKQYVDERRSISDNITSQDKQLGEKLSTEQKKGDELKEQTEKLQARRKELEKVLTVNASQLKKIEKQEAENHLMEQRIEKESQDIKKRGTEIAELIKDISHRARQYSPNRMHSDGLQELLTILSSRPGAYDRWRAMLLFGKFLKSVPAGSYEND